MQLDISLDQRVFLRPTRRLFGHTVRGVAGKAAALALLEAQP